MKNNNPNSNWARGPVVRGPTVRPEKVANWAPDSWPRGPVVRGPTVHLKKDCPLYIENSYLKSHNHNPKYQLHHPNQ